MRWACDGIGALLLVVAASLATAQSYPSKPIRITVAQAPGGPTDVVTRIYSTKLAELAGQPVVVDNRVGAGGTVAAEILSRSAADGYTLCAMANGTAAIAPHFIKTSYDVLKDFTAVALIGDSPLALMVHPAVPARTLRELIELAKAKPGAINFGSSGQGSTGQLAAEMFRLLAGVTLTHVPYKGALPALIGLAGGEIQMLVSGVSTGLAFIKSGQVRALGVTGAKRVSSLPDVPAIGEVVPGYEANSWFAVFTRTGTPRGIVNRLNELSVRVVESPDVRARLAAASVDPLPLTPDELAQKIRRDHERWGKVVKAAGVKVQ